MIAMARSATVRKFLTFAGVGAGVFVFDALSFASMLRLGLVPPVARGVSVLLAMTLSWWLNRSLTFHVSVTRLHWTEWGKFLLSQAPGAAVNGATSLLVLRNPSLFAQEPIIAVAFGSLAGMVINFLLASIFVFSKKQ